MGEYATYRGESVKIGTCEDMYYLRADQAHLVHHEHGNVDPVRERESLRFRFPFPDEDTIEPGAFDNHAKGLRVYGVNVPEGVEHYSVQFRAENGYLVSLPCPESVYYDESGSAILIGRKITDRGDRVPGTESCRIQRNGYGGAVQIVQQRYWNGLLVTVCECKGCGAKYRLETLDDAAEVLNTLGKMHDDKMRDAERNGTKGDAIIAEQYAEIARRIVAGYLVGADA